MTNVKQANLLSSLGVAVIFSWSGFIVFCRLGISSRLFFKDGIANQLVVSDEPVLPFA